MKKALFAVIGALLVLSSAAPSKAHTHSICSERAELIEKLKKGYLEEPISIGLAANGSVIEVFASNSGSFSIVITRPEGISCLVAAGKNWLSLPAHKAETGV